MMTGKLKAFITMEIEKLIPFELDTDSKLWFT